VNDKCSYLDIFSRVLQFKICQSLLLLRVEVACYFQERFICNTVMYKFYFWILCALYCRIVSSCRRSSVFIFSWNYFIFPITNIRICTWVTLSALSLLRWCLEAVGFWSSVTAWETDPWKHVSVMFMWCTWHYYLLSLFYSCLHYINLLFHHKIMIEAIISVPNHLSFHYKMIHV